MSKFLVISAGGQARVVTNTPRLRLDEFAYRLTINIPDTWASVIGEITINLPEPDPTVEMASTEREPGVTEVMGDSDSDDGEGIDDQDYE